MIFLLPTHETKPWSLLCTFMHWFLRTNRKAFLSLSVKQAWYSVGRKEICNKFTMFFTLEQHLKHNDVILALPKSATKLPSTTVKPELQFYTFLNIPDKWMPDLQICFTCKNASLLSQSSKNAFDRLAHRGQADFSNTETVESFWPSLRHELSLLFTLVALR